MNIKYLVGCAVVGLGLILSGAVANAQNVAERSVTAAKEFSGTSINTLEEAGLMAMLGINFTGPQWEELTGIKVNVSESPYLELFPKTMVEHRGRSGAYDMLTISPAWLADLVTSGALEPLDPFMDKYGGREEWDDINPAFKDYMSWKGKTYALMVDGDVFVLYYRKDIFEDPDNMAAFRAKHGYGLAPPKTWQQFAEISQFITDKYAPETYGSGLIHTGYMHFFFSERFRNYGGRFFDMETMKATINSEAGVQALTDLIAQTKSMPPGVEAWGFIESLASLSQGHIAMTISWPPVGRWAEGLYEGEDALSWVPKTSVKGKIGYASPPGGHPELAAGIMLAISPHSKNKDAAYLYMQWLHSKQESLKNVMSPVGLRDPFRLSHYQSKDYQNLWPGAKEYLQVLWDGAANGLADLAVINTFKYMDDMAREVVAAIAGKDPKEALDDVAAMWDETTEKIGVDKQREAYRVWASKASAYRD